MWSVKMSSSKYIAIFLFSVFISSCSQIILKKSADKNYRKKIEEILNPMVILAYGCFLFASFLTMVAYRGIELSLGPVLESTSYIYILILSKIFLQEKITGRKIAGVFLIIFGIFISTL